MSVLSRVADAVRSVYAPKSAGRVRAHAYRGAVENRLTEDWIFATIRSADAEIKGDLRTLRRRARELARNTPHARRFTELLADNVIGEHGIRLQSRPPLTGGAEGEIDEDAAARIEDAFAEWTEAENCSADGKLAFNELEELALTSEATDGECLVRMLPGFRNRWGFALQALDPDQLDEQHNLSPDAERANEIRMGVEVNAWNRPVAYHLYDHHPYDFQGWGRRDRKRIPAAQMIHSYQIRRPGQTRGVSWLAPVLMDTQMLAALQEAELVASRIAAVKSGVFYQEDGEPEVDPDAPAGGDVDFTWSMEMGVFDKIPAGLKAHFFDPQHPNSAFEAFNKIILRTIAAGLGTSYASLTGDLRDVNFSSIRHGALQERDIYRRLQRRQSRRFNRVVFLEWLKWAMTTGALDLPFDQMARYRRHVWQPRGWDWVDPLKDLKAAELAIALGVDSRSRLAAQRGRDYGDTVRELRRELDLARRAGVDVSGAVGGNRTKDEDDDAEALLRALEDADEATIAAALAGLNGKRSRIAGLLQEG